MEKELLSLSILSSKVTPPSRWMMKFLIYFIVHRSWLVGTYGIEPPADIFRLKWLIVVVIRCHFAPLKRSPILTDKTLIIMSNNKFKSWPVLIHHLLRGFVADVRPHGKPTTKLKIANYNKYNKHTGGEGKNRTSLLRGFEPWRTFHCAAPTFTGWGARDSSCKTHKQQDFHLQACPFIPIYS